MYVADKVQSLREIQEISFGIQDISLYLDTHPTDTEALNRFNQLLIRRKDALSEFATNFYPLTVDCIKAENEKKSGNDTVYGGINHWTWMDGDIPWAGVCE